MAGPGHLVLIFFLKINLYLICTHVHVVGPLHVLPELEGAFEVDVAHGTVVDAVALGPAREGGSTIFSLHGEQRENCRKAEKLFVVVLRRSNESE
jgi:hypothetical protein